MDFEKEVQGLICHKTQKVQQMDLCQYFMGNLCYYVIRCISGKEIFSEENQENQGGSEKPREEWEATIMKWKDWNQQ